MKPQYRDPVFDGAADPVVVWNRAERRWWMVYTSRRAFGPELAGVEWVHGTVLGVASSDDFGASWTYRGDLDGLDLGWGRTTYWAPEIFDDGTMYHMFVSVVNGMPSQWPGHPRQIRHYASPDLVTWRFLATLELSSQFVIDACVVALPQGGYRLWYKDEADDSHTWAADSADLEEWTVIGRAVGGDPHEGPNVFELGDAWWMLVDEWRGQRVLRSEDLVTWDRHGLILDASGSAPEDTGVGHHADVVPTGADEATVFYFTHPERTGAGVSPTYRERRSTVHAARIRLREGTLICDRDEPFTAAPLPKPLL